MHLHASIFLLLSTIFLCFFFKLELFFLKNILYHVMISEPTPVILLTRTPHLQMTQSISLHQVLQSLGECKVVMIMLSGKCRWNYYFNFRFSQDAVIFLLLSQCSFCKTKFLYFELKLVCRSTVSLTFIYVVKLHIWI